MADAGSQPMPAWLVAIITLSCFLVAGALAWGIWALVQRQRQEKRKEGLSSYERDWMDVLLNPRLKEAEIAERLGIPTRDEMKSEEYFKKAETDRTYARQIERGYKAWNLRDLAMLSDSKREKLAKRYVAQQRKVLSKSFQDKGASFAPVFMFDKHPSLPKYKPSSFNEDTTQFTEEAPSIPCYEEFYGGRVQEVPLTEAQSQQLCLDDLRYGGSKEYLKTMAELRMKNNGNKPVVEKELMDTLLKTSCPTSFSRMGRQLLPSGGKDRLWFPEDQEGPGKRNFQWHKGLGMCQAKREVSLAEDVQRWFGTEVPTVEQGVSTRLNRELRERAHQHEVEDLFKPAASTR